MLPLFKIIKTRDLSKLSVINDNVFFLSIMFDFTVIAVNTTFSMRVVISYFEFMAILTFYQLFSMIFKLKLYLM